MLIKEREKMVKQIAMVLSSNCLVLLKGIFVSIMIPKILSLESYGTYKIFTLYVSYMGLLHFGLIDGIAVKFAGKNLESIGLPKVRMYTKLLIGMEIVEMLLLFVMGYYFFRGSQRYLIYLLAIDVPIHNMNTYCTTLMQISMQFKKYTYVTTLDSILQTMGVLILFVLALTYNATAWIYIGIFICGEVAVLVTCLCTARGILFGKRDKITYNKKEIHSLFKIGFPLLIAGIVSTLVYNLDRQFVSVFFSRTEYATYAFAYSMMNLITVLVSAMSIVLYPSLKRVDRGTAALYYKKISALIPTLIFLLFGGVQIFVKFIEWFLPEYRLSIEILIYILPSTVTICLLQIVLINYYKIIENTKQYFILSIVALLISFILNCIAVYTFHSMKAIALATVIACLLWYCIGDWIIQKKLCIKHYLWPYILIMTLVYYGVYLGMGQSKLLSGITYFMLYIIITSLINRKITKNLIIKFRR